MDSVTELNPVFIIRVFNTAANTNIGAYINANTNKLLENGICLNERFDLSEKKAFCKRVDRKVAKESLKDVSL